MHKHVLRDFIGLAVLEIEGGVFLNEMVMIGEIAMNNLATSGFLMKMIRVQDNEAKASKQST